MSDFVWNSSGKVEGREIMQVRYHDLGVVWRIWSLDCRVLCYKQLNLVLQWLLLFVFIYFNLLGWVESGLFISEMML